MHGGGWLRVSLQREGHRGAEIPQQELRVGLSTLPTLFLPWGRLSLCPPFPRCSPPRVGPLEEKGGMRVGRQLCGEGCPGPFWVGTRRGGWSGRRQRVGLEGRDGGVGQELAAWGAVGWLGPTPQLPYPCSVPRRCAVGTGSPCSSVRVVALVSPHGGGKGSLVLPQGPSWPGFGILRPLLVAGLGTAWGHPWDLGLRAARGSGVLLRWGAGVPAPRYPKNISGFCWLAGL